MLAAACLLGAPAAACAAQAAPRSWLTVQQRPVAQVFHAYGRVEPIATVRLRTAEPGTIDGLQVVPGSAVRAGQVLARLRGPRMRVLLVADVQHLHAARARERAARRELAIARRQVGAELATRQQLDAAQSALAAARASTRSAAARLRAARALQAVRAPVSGTVLSVEAADGEQLPAGQVVATLQPQGKLWLRAQYYGADASQLHVGMSGRFRPAGGARAVAVQVVAISAALAADGGLRVGLLPTGVRSPPGWRNGQWGSLVLDGPVRPMVLVPTQALILDRGHWWVLLHTPSGDTPRRVVPGPARGWQTAIASGLSAGQRVVVTDAFLEYHRGIASRYTPPD